MSYLPYLEARVFCNENEYIEAEKFRVVESDLSVGGLYRVFFQLHEPPAEYYGVVQPGKLESIKPMGIGQQHEAGVDLLNQDLRKEYMTTAVLQNGFWMDVAYRVSFDAAEPTNAFLVPYADAEEQGYQSLITRTKKEQALASE